MMFNNNASVATALDIGESLILCLGDRKNLAESEVVGILQDAISPHVNAPANLGMIKMRETVAVIIKSLIDDGNSLRRRHNWKSFK
jgi:hypothetical protein